VSKRFVAENVGVSASPWEAAYKCQASIADPSHKQKRRCVAALLP
jgi:hypothetical protein